MNLTDGMVGNGSKYLEPKCNGLYTNLIARYTRLRRLEDGEDVYLKCKNL